MSPDGKPKAPPPEERLLRLIRGKASEPSPVQSTPAAGAASITLSGGKSKAIHSFKGKGIKWASILLGVALVVEVVFIVIQLTRPFPVVELPRIEKKPPESAPQAELQKFDAPKLSRHSSKDVFKSPVVAHVEPQGRKGPSVEANALAERLILLGIVSGESPQAIIEDSQTKKTYFVSAGQRVVEGAVVDEVLDNRAVLDLNGEKIELSL